MRARSTDTIVAAGGDGTLNEVVAALIKVWWGACVMWHVVGRVRAAARGTVYVGRDGTLNEVVAALIKVRGERGHVLFGT